MDLDFNYFLFYGKIDLHEEVKADIMQGAMQDSRSMSYYRDFGAGISDYENAPNEFGSAVALKYNLANWIAKRNQDVSDGSNGTRDRRAVTSQNAITIVQNHDEMDIQLLYILFADMKKPQTVSMPLSGSK